MYEVFLIEEKQFYFFNSTDKKQLIAIVNTNTYNDFINYRKAKLEQNSHNN